MMPTRVQSRPEEGFYASEVQTPRRLPVLTFLPNGYEPNYAYPLVVFFHGRGGCEKQLVHLAPRLSRRNYICLGLRGPEALMFRKKNDPEEKNRIGYAWGAGAREDSLTEEYVIRAIEQARRKYHIHSERIFLAGVCEGAALAYRLGLTYPEKFAGVIALNGRLAKSGPLRLPQVRQLRVLIGHGIANAIVPLANARDDFRLLYTAGLDVRLRTYPTTHRLHADMLKDIDRWIMDLVLASDEYAATEDE